MAFSELALLGPVWLVPCCLFVFMVGACFGSFVNCFAWRSQNNASILGGRSHCTSCGACLGLLDLIPVFSWLFLRGRCRHCGASVAARYMVTELLSGFYFLSIFVYYGATVHCLALWALGCILLGLSLCDYESFIIPNGCILGIIALWVIDIALSAVFPSEQFAVAAFPHVLAPLLGESLLAVAVEGVVASALITAFMLVMTVLVSKRTGADSMGGGDLKLFFCVSLFLGLCGSFLNLILSCLIGLIFGALFKTRFANDCGEASVKAKRFDKEIEPLPGKAFPFGPSIALGTWLTLLLGPAAVGAYLTLL